MVWGFGSSSSSSSSSYASSSASSSNPAATTSPAVSVLSDTAAPPAPNREQRAACWAGRDAYFGCLIKNGVVAPGEENKGLDGKEIEGGGSTCKVERGEYERNCGKSWIDYFNKRRTLELRQQATMQAAAKQGVKVTSARS